MTVSYFPTSDANLAEEPYTNALDKAFENIILTTLDRKFPLYSFYWHVDIKSKINEGMVYIKNMLVDGEMGFQMHIATFTTKDLEDLAGEFFEHFRLKRDKNVDIRDQINGMERRATGKAVFDE